MKYNFYNGKDAKKIKYRGYKYLGKDKLGKIKTIKIDNKTAYYLVDYFNDYIRLSKNTFDKSKFKEVEIEDLEYKGNWSAEDDYIEKQEPKKELIFNTKIQIPKDRFLSSVKIKLGEEDYILFFKINKSNIIKDLQLKNNDELIIKIKKKKL